MSWLIDCVLLAVSTICLSFNLSPKGLVSTGLRITRGDEPWIGLGIVVELPSGGQGPVNLKEVLQAAVVAAPDVDFGYRVASKDLAQANTLDRHFGRGKPEVEQVKG